MAIDKELLKKHKEVLDAARKYWVENVPTGLTDEEYDKLEKEAQKDGIEPRNVVTEGQKRTKNADYLTKVPKIRVKLGDSMKSTIQKIHDENQGKVYWNLKYDGSSTAWYFENGECVRVVTAGGDNLTGMGVDQTAKLSKYAPKVDPRIKCLHCEVLVSLDHEGVSRNRQKANGLINSTKEQLLDEIDELLNIRVFRYFSDYKIDNPIEFLRSIEMTKNSSGDIKFAPCQIFSTEELLSLDDKVLEGVETITNTGTFQFDGFVAYSSETGEVITAVKSDHGGVDELSEVVEMLWNNQVGKGKDGWSLNVKLDPPAEVKGSTIRKPSSGGVPTAIKKNITVGARVKVGLAGGTIPKVTEVVQGGNGDMCYPTCKCGYQMSEKNIFGSNLKCGNPDCEERYERMMKYLSTVSDPDNIDFNRFLVIDRFDFNKKLDPSDQLDLVNNLFLIVSSDELGPDHFKQMLESYIHPTGLQKKMLDLVSIPAYRAIKDTYFSRLTDNGDFSDFI
jgi:hypothetical protein